MPRIRTIKPEFFTSEQVVECSTNARLLFVGMWCFCDDGGVHPASVKRLKMEVFPGDSFTESDIQTMVDELLEQGLLESYTVGNQGYWRVTGWSHQRIDKPNPKYPTPESTGTVTDRSGNGTEKSADRSLLEGKGREGKGRTTAAAAAREYPPEFLEAMAAYPRRAGDNPKPRALKAWRARRKEGHTPEEIIAGVKRYAAWCERRGKVGTELVKQAATFFGPDKSFLESWADGGGREPDFVRRAV